MGDDGGGVTEFLRIDGVKRKRFFGRKKRRAFFFFFGTMEDEDGPRFVVIVFLNLDRENSKGRVMVDE